jgi:hypothetical protein
MSGEILIFIVLTARIWLLVVFPKKIAQYELLNIRIENDSTFK